MELYININGIPGDQVGLEGRHQAKGIMHLKAANAVRWPIYIERVIEHLLDSPYDRAFIMCEGLYLLALHLCPCGNVERDQANGPASVEYYMCRLWIDINVELGCRCIIAWHKQSSTHNHHFLHLLDNARFLPQGQGDICEWTKRYQ